MKRALFSRSTNAFSVTGVFSHSRKPIYFYLSCKTDFRAPAADLSISFSGKMPSYKLTYFNVRGLSEMSRLMFALVGQEYEDIRLTNEEWAQVKPTTPFGQVPVLEVDGLAIGQSGAISRYLARKFNLYGSNDEEAAVIDGVLCVLDDLLQCLIKAHFEKDETRKAEILNENLTEKFPRYMGMLESVLKRNRGSGYCVGDKLTLADLAIYDRIYNLKDGIDFSDYPLIQKCRNIVHANPKIKEWVDKRPRTEY